jgi:hypothetical protein
VYGANLRQEIVISRNRGVDLSLVDTKRIFWVILFPQELQGAIRL